MNQLIPVINKLQDVLKSVGVNDANIDLPQIAVVGSQSVGKSSVLEFIVGRDFLPRGTGIVTRRPIVLQLIHITQGDDYAEFTHAPGQKFFDFNKVRGEIERETERIVGNNKAISAIPIILKIFSQHVIDLTVVDLPGITKVPVGDQPADIEEQVRRMVLSFISKPNCIILAVSAGNSDLANSDGLKFARDVDPEGHRTLGVITKTDLMEAGTDATEILAGRVYPLRLGYVTVVCRGPSRNKASSVRDALREEAEFFQERPVYHPYSSRCGSANLAKILNKVLLMHIVETLPELQRRIEQQLFLAEEELQQYGDPALLDSQYRNPGALLLLFFSKFARNLQDMIDGKQVVPSGHSHATAASSGSSNGIGDGIFLSSRQSPNVDLSLSGGARLSFLFHDWYGATLASYDPLSALTDGEIRVAMRNAAGPKAALFVSEGAFEILVRRLIERLEKPSLQLVDQVHKELIKMVETCELAEASRYPRLQASIRDVVNNVLTKCLQPTTHMVSNLVQVELGYINTSHPDFADAVARLSLQEQQQQQQQYYSNSNNRAVNFLNGNQHSHMMNGSNMQNNQPNNINNSTGLNGQNQSSSHNGYLDEDSTQPRHRNSIPNNNNNNNANSLSNASRRDPSSPSGPNPSDPPSNNNNNSGGIGLFSFLSHRSIFSATPSTSALAAAAQQIQQAQPTPSPPAIHIQQQIQQQHQQHQQQQQYYAQQQRSVMRSSFEMYLPPVPAVVAPSDEMSERERQEMMMIKRLLSAYFDIVRKNLVDLVPKSVMFFMVNTVKDVVQRELVASLYKEDLFTDLLSEADGLAEKRSNCKEKISALRAALSALQEVTVKATVTGTQTVGSVVPSIIGGGGR